MQVISSKENESVKNVKKLKEKKYRDLENKFLVEGIKLVEEAINENAKIALIVVCEECVKDGSISKELLYKIAKYECIYVTEKVFNILSDVKSPQGILAVIQKSYLENEIDYSQDITIALDDIQDPGNLGTILRTVDSAGLNQIIVSKNSSDSYSPKVVRSTMGAIFRVRIIETENLCETLKQIKSNNFEIVVTSLDTQDSIYDMQYKNKVIVVGNEANGVSKQIQDLADKKVKIPMLRKNRKLKCICCSKYYDLRICKKKVRKIKRKGIKNEISSAKGKKCKGRSSRKNSRKY